MHSASEIVCHIRDIKVKLEDILTSFTHTLNWENISSDEVEKIIHSFFGSAVAYAEVFRNLSVKNYEELEALIRNNYRNENVRNVHEELEQIETDWMENLNRVDKCLGFSPTGRNQGDENCLQNILKERFLSANHCDEPGMTLEEHLRESSSSPITLMILIRHFA
ncbi:unnamed protein product [Cyprideis torosa]|uniref:Uncharacterized protein n=1 Tax=Cyprideis torosa TaxID=163714 RepID=A0A7R8ZU07_9CRUS|nr:unnamed protein product [Cyprideis torosa]CAG0899382.1 unnamed protein product [Cyprideis torosa]